MSQKSYKNSPVASLLVLIAIAHLMAGCAHSQKHDAAGAQHRFDNIDFWVKMFEDPERDAWQKPEEVVDAMKLGKGKIIADLGAGTGYFTRRFAVAVGPSGKAIGLDVEPNMVQYMRDDARKLGLSNYTARIVKTENPELEKGSLDVVFLCNTYHHIENRVEYFRNVALSLKPGGRVISVDFYKNTDFGPPRDHKLSREVVLKEMSEAGFRFLKSHDILPEQYFLEFGL